MSDAATVEYSSETKTLGDQIAELTLKQAKELSDYLENELKARIIMQHTKPHPPPKTCGHPLSG